MPRIARIDDRHDVFLADAIETPDALLDTHRIPGQVVIDHRVRELQVPAFAAGLGGDQHLWTRLVAEPRYSGVLLCWLQLSVEKPDRPLLAENSCQVRLRVAKLGEDQDLDVGLSRSQVAEPVAKDLRLAVDLDRIEHLDQGAKLCELLQPFQP